MKILKIVLALLLVVTMSFTVEEEHKKKTAAVHNHVHQNHETKTLSSNDFSKASFQIYRWHCIYCGDSGVTTTSRPPSRRGCRSPFSGDSRRHFWRAGIAPPERIYVPAGGSLRN
jgi:hypothetical protein